MPFIHVKSLPFEQAIEMPALVQGLTEDFAEGTGVGLEHVTATWIFLQPGHYAVAGNTSAGQPATSHPVLVDLLSPDFNSQEQIENMLRIVAASISKRTLIPLNNIFINHRQASSGRVFDAGEIVRW